MSRWLALVVALVAACGDREPAAGSGSAPVSNAPPPRVVPDGAGDRLGTGPVLEAIDAPLPADARAIAPFAEERRDEAWAKATESSLRASLEELDGVSSLAVECRTSQCQVTLGVEAGRAIAATGELESSLRGQAAAIVFGDTRGERGEVVVYVQFAR